MPATNSRRTDEFASFMRAYQDMVFSTAARLLGSRTQAQDIAQEVFLRAYEHFDQLSCSTTQGGWLKTVATNLCLNHLSRHRKRWRLFSELRRSESEEEPVIDVALPDTLLDDLVAQERGEILERALGRLPDHQRIPLILYHFEDMAYADICRRLGVSLAKVKIDILRGRISLAKALADAAPAADGARR